MDSVTTSSSGAAWPLDLKNGDTKKSWCLVTVGFWLVSICFLVTALKKDKPRVCQEWHGDPSIFLQMVGTAAGIQGSAIQPLRWFAVANLTGVMLRGHLLVELVHMLPYPPMFKGVRHLACRECDRRNLPP